MTKQTPSQHSMLKQVAEEDVPSGEIELWAGLQKNLDMREFTNRGRSSSVQNRPSRIAAARRWQFAAASIFLLAVAVMMVSSPGQALAQQVLRFFIPAKATSYPAPTAVLTVSALDGKVDYTPAPTVTPSYSENCMQTDLRRLYACALDFAQQRSGFPLRALPIDFPLELTGMDLDPAEGAVSLYYGPNATIILTQRNIPFPQSIRSAENDIGEVPTEAVQEVMINGQPGEYVEGGFVLKPGSLEYTWESSMPMARLRWKDGDTWLQMQKPGTPEELNALMGDRDSFIRLAESLVPVEEITNP